MMPTKKKKITPTPFQSTHTHPDHPQHNVKYLSKSWTKFESWNNNCFVNQLNINYYHAFLN